MEATLPTKAPAYQLVYVQRHTIVSVQRLHLTIMFKERLLFLTNEATVGVFRSEASTVFVLLSGNGEFVKIYRGESSSVHLTRYCPVASDAIVRKLLTFRNRYAARPYLCERFHRTSEPFLGSSAVTWDSDQKYQRIHGSSWRVHTNRDGRTVFAVCPCRKRLCYFSDAIFVPDSSIGYYQAQQSSELRVVRHTTVVPFENAPAYFQKDYGSYIPSNHLATPGKGREIKTERDMETDRSIQKAHLQTAYKSKQNYLQGNQWDYITEIPNSIECGASDSSSACEFFKEIEHELVILKSLSRYPTTLDLAVKIEDIDGEIFICTTTSSANDKNENKFEDISVENWIKFQPQNSLTGSQNRNRNENRNKKNEKDRTMNVDNDLYSYAEEEVEVADIISDTDFNFGCNGCGPLMTLKGDYFTFYGYQSTDLGPSAQVQNEIVRSPVDGIKIHVSLLYCTSTYEENNENQGSTVDEEAKDIKKSRSEVIGETVKFHANKIGFNDIEFDGQYRYENNYDGLLEVERDVENDSNLSISSILRIYRLHAIRLLEYREYLQPRNTLFLSALSVPYCLRSVRAARIVERTRISSTCAISGSGRGIGSRSSSGSSSSAVGAGGALREDGQLEYEENDNNHQNDSHDEIDNENHNENVKFSNLQSYGGSYYIKNGKLIEIFNDGAVSNEIKYNMNGGTYSSSNSSSSSSSGRGGSSSSSGSGNSKRFDHYQNTGNHLDMYEKNIVKLISAVGAKYTAYPTTNFTPHAITENMIGSCRSEADDFYGQYNYFNATDNGQHRNDFYSPSNSFTTQDMSGMGRNLIQGPRPGQPVGRYSKVRGVFPDRSQVDLCLSTKVSLITHDFFLLYTLILSPLNIRPSHNRYLYLNLNLNPNPDSNPNPNPNSKFCCSLIPYSYSHCHCTSLLLQHSLQCTLKLAPKHTLLITNFPPLITSLPLISTLTQTLKALLPDGKEITLTLSECLTPLKSLENSKELLFLRDHVISLISFHTFACTAPSERILFMSKFSSRTSLTQAAVNRSERYLKIQKIISANKPTVRHNDPMKIKIECPRSIRDTIRDGRYGGYVSNLEGQYVIVTPTTTTTATVPASLTVPVPGPGPNIGSVPLTTTTTVLGTGSRSGPVSVSVPLYVPLPVPVSIPISVPVSVPVKEVKVKVSDVPLVTVKSKSETVYNQLVKGRLPVGASMRIIEVEGEIRREVRMKELMKEALRKSMEAVSSNEILRTRQQQQQQQHEIPFSMSHNI